MADYTELESLIKKEYEQMLLGNILIDKEIMPLISPTLKAKDFAIPEHEEIFNAMKSLYAKSEPIDIVSVSDRIKEIKKGGALTPTIYLAQLAGSIAETTNALYYAKKISEAASKRRMIKYFSIVDYTKPLQDIVLNVRQELDKTHIANSTPKLVEDINLDEIEELATKKTFHTHFPTFNQSARITSGELITIVGNFADGKTTLAFNLADDIAKSGGTIQFFTLDMTKYQLLGRIASMKYGIPAMEVMPDSPTFVENILKAYETDLAKHLVLESKTVYLSDIIGKIRAENPDVVIIDYVQNIEVEGVTNTVEALNKVVIALRVESHDRPIILLSQVSKGEGTYIDRAKGSSTIAQASSLVVEIKKEEEQLKYKISKNRSVGIVTGWVNLNFEFWNLSEEI